MRIHFTAVGGAVMHSLAIALKRQGHTVTGSDDKIADPAKSNLLREGILPEAEGFYPEKISKELDAVILGMHARIDNPELLRAQELNIPIYSFPHFIYEVSKNKKRVVIAGSHGKTTITSMVMHVLHTNGIDIDYMVGAKVKGFDTGVRLSDTAPIIILEGDEYLASPIERESKFMFYHPHVALITGVAWDHINVFPVYEGYVNQFRKFANSVEDGGAIAYYEGDAELQRIFAEYNFSREDAKTQSVKVLPYSTSRYEVRDNRSYIITDQGEYPMLVFGAHNMQNMEGARKVCGELGITDHQFYTAMSSFEGAANRLEKLGENTETVIYKDFAHSPSKLTATVNAMKEQYANRNLVAVMELHTFSSLNKDFLSEYAHAMDRADVAVVFIDDEAMKLKQMPPLDHELIIHSFGKDGLKVFTSKDELQSFLLSQKWAQSNLLLMSSGHFGGMDLKNLTKVVLGTV
jgi:UDP-N-acetylmuramate: L-alanyl-gamma-D-glutamyl-meso-diaminopimelate ligase